MKKISLILAALFVLILCVAFTVPAFADETADVADTAEATDLVTVGAAEEPVQDATGSKAIAAAIAVGLAAAAGAVGMGIAVAGSTGAMARQPESHDKINSAMMLGLVFIETAIIYALVIAILIIFVL